MQLLVALNAISVIVSSYPIRKKLLDESQRLRLPNEEIRLKAATLIDRGQFLLAFYLELEGSG